HRRPRGRRRVARAMGMRFVRATLFALPIQLHGRADMKTWEYKIIIVRSENYSMDPRRAEELNRLGDEGWELVSITSINFKTGATDHIGMVFKREKASSS